MTTFTPIDSKNVVPVESPVINTVQERIGSLAQRIAKAISPRLEQVLGGSTVLLVGSLSVLQAILSFIPIVGQVSLVLLALIGIALLIHGDRREKAEFAKQESDSLKISFSEATENQIPTPTAPNLSRSRGLSARGGPVGSPSDSLETLFSKPPMALPMITPSAPRLPSSETVPDEEIGSVDDESNEIDSIDSREKEEAALPSADQLQKRVLPSNGEAEIDKEEPLLISQESEEPGLDNAIPLAYQIVNVGTQSEENPGMDAPVLSPSPTTLKPDTLNSSKSTVEIEDVTESEETDSTEENPEMEPILLSIDPPPTALHSETVNSANQTVEKKDEEAPLVMFDESAYRSAVVEAVEKKDEEASLAMFDESAYRSAVVEAVEKRDEGTPFNLFNPSNYRSVVAQTEKKPETTQEKRENSLWSLQEALVLKNREMERVAKEKELATNVQTPKVVAKVGAADSLLVKTVKKVGDFILGTVASAIFITACTAPFLMAASKLDLAVGHPGQANY